jgi:hypothetical protein
MAGEVLTWQLVGHHVETRITSGDRITQLTENVCIKLGHIYVHCDPKTKESR